MQLSEFRRHAVQYGAQIRGLQYAHEKIATTDNVIAIKQGGVDPRTFNGVVHMFRKINNRCCTARQPVKFRCDVFFQRCRIDVEVLEELPKIGVLILNDLVHPMHQFHIRIASQLTGHRGSLRSTEHLCIKLAKQVVTTNFGHQNLNGKQLKSITN